MERWAPCLLEGIQPVKLSSWILAASLKYLIRYSENPHPSFEHRKGI